MAYMRKSLSTLYSQDGDSGLSMPSGTMNSSLSRLGEQEHGRLIRSLLGRSTESLPGAYHASAFSLPRQPRSASVMTDVFARERRSASPEPYRSQSSPSKRATQSPSLYTPMSETTYDLMTTDMLHSTRMTPAKEKLTSLAPSNYFTVGLNNALNESEGRRNVLLEKLKEAQDTLRLQSARLSKMETDYHGASYQVEELKSQDNQRLKQIADLEKKKQELNELRLRDLDVQMVLQDRVKELEGALQTIASDFQLLEADHARRRELVEQLSTTVELVEEENQKLHKADQKVGTELQCMKQQVNSHQEEKQSLSSQLDSQRREAKHWREETEKQQNALRQSQETISELRVKVTSLTHRLESTEASERQLRQENTELRNKERDSHDTLTDLKSKVAIMTADKERFYQEKSDLTKEIDRLSLLHRQIQDDMQQATLTNRNLSYDLELRQQTLDQLTENLAAAKDELLASQKVGEKLSEELTRTKESLERKQEVAVSTEETARRHEETIGGLQTQCSELKKQLAKAQTEVGDQREEMMKQKAHLSRSLDSAKSELDERNEEVTRLNETVVTLRQKLNSLEKTSESQITRYQEEANMWQEKCDNFKQVHTRKDEEILELNRRLSECDIELTKLIHERDMKRVNYDDMLRLQQDNQRLSSLNNRLSQESAESEQMVQLLQTQRDIYARSVQEYSAKLTNSEQLTDTNKHLRDQLYKLRESVNEAETQLETLRKENSHLESQMSESNKMAEVALNDREELKIRCDSLEQENSHLKSISQENKQLREQLCELQELKTASNKEKINSKHLSEENDKLSIQITKLDKEKGTLSKENQELTNEIIRLTKLYNETEQQLSTTQQEMIIATRAHSNLQKELEERSEALTKIQQSETCHKDSVTLLKNVKRQLESQLLELKERLSQEGHLRSECDRFKEKITELTRSQQQCDLAVADLQQRNSELQEKLQAATSAADERSGAARMLSSDCELLNHDKRRLEMELEMMRGRLNDLQLGTDNQIKSMDARLGKSEECRLATQQILDETRQRLAEKERELKRLSSELTAQSRTVADLSSSVAALRLELKESCELQAKQEELIATLKDETAILNDLELELKDTRKRCKELQKLNEEQKALVNMLKKDAQIKEKLEGQLQEISADLMGMKSELHAAYSAINQKELEVERLQKLLNNATLDADNSEEKVAELKIRLDQAEKAKEVSSSTLQERIHGMEAENSLLKSQILKLERELADINGRLNSSNSELNRSYDESQFNKESITTLRLERDTMQSECKALRANNSNLLATQSSLESEKRKLQLQMKEIKMDMFKLEKENDGLEKSNERLTLSLNESNQLLTQITSEREKAQVRLDTLQTEVINSKKENKNIKDQLLEATKRNSQTEERLQTEVRQLHTQAANLKSQLRELQFLNAQNVTDSNITNNSDNNFTTKPQVMAATQTDEVNDSQSEENPSFTADPADPAYPAVATVIADPSPPETHRALESAFDDLLNDLSESSPIIEAADDILVETDTCSTDESNRSDASGSASLPMKSDPNASPLHTLKSGESDELLLRVEQELDASDEVLTENTEEDTEENPSEQQATSASDPSQQSSITDPVMTRDKTLKIFKQLKKAKKRSKKCLAPPTKLKAKIDRDTSIERTDSFEKRKRGEEEDDRELHSLKQDILTKSGKVEWRGDPREAHRRYLSSWDLSVIADVEEADNSLASRHGSSAKSLPNLNAAGGMGSTDSIQSIGMMDSPLLLRKGSRSDVDTTGSAISLTLTDDTREMTPRQDEGEMTPRGTQEEETTPRGISSKSPHSPSRIPKLSGKTSPKSDSRSASKTTPKSTASNLPKLQLFKRTA